MRAHMMWTHYCKPDKAWLSVERGEPCNWCDAPETLEEPDDADDELE